MLTIRALVLLLTFAAAPAAIAQVAAPPAAKSKKPHPGLLDPKQAVEKAPAKFDVLVSTTKGDLIITVHRDWSPNGADRFYNLVNIGYFNDIGIFRAIKGFMVQFGIHGDPNVNKAWSDATIKDDPQKRGISNKTGMITFARTPRKDSRSTQFFVNLGNNGRLDPDGFTPFGQITKGAEVIAKINTDYGENTREVQSEFEAKGNTYIRKRYPKIDFIKSIQLVKPSKATQ